MGPPLILKFEESIENIIQCKSSIQNTLIE